MKLIKSRSLLNKLTVYLSKVNYSSTSSSSVDTVIPNVNLNEPRIGRTFAEYQYLFLQQPDMPTEPKVLKISILGVPNSGKSTLVNRLLNRRASF